MSKLTHQICIIGAGPVGLALANCLALSPHINSIALIDRKMPKIMAQPYSIPNQRVYSINAPTLKLLDNIGALPRIRQYGTLSNIEVMSKQSSTFIEWQEKQAKIIENDQLVNAIFCNIQEPKLKSKIEFIQGQIESFHNDVYSQCQVTLKDRKITTKLLVGSDGNRSKVKELAKIPTYGWSYRQKAIACTLSMKGIDETSNNSAYQIYHDGNILGFLPLWKNYVSIVWSLQIPDFQHIMQLDDSKFVDSLNNVINNTNHALKTKSAYRPMNQIDQLINKRLSFPLSTLQSQFYTKHRLALVGDAAHSIHPMAGLGVNSGILDGAMLANNVILNKKTGNDIGQSISLSGYETKSKAMNYGNSVAMESIKKAFQIDAEPINFLRSSILNLFQDSGIIKKTMKGLVENNPLADIPRYEWEHV